MTLIENIIEDFRVRSFFMDGNLQCDCSVVYLKSDDNSWFSVTIGEGYLNIRKETEEPAIVDIDKINNDFSYPVREDTFFDNYKGCSISSISEYRLKDRCDITIGAFFEFSSGGFTLCEDDDCLFFEHGISVSLLQTCDLVKIS